jgi:penicillin-binding protein 2
MADDEEEEKKPEEPKRYAERDHAWFVAFAPASDPRVAVAVMVEHGGSGSKAAGPIAKKIIEIYLGVPAPEGSSALVPDVNPSAPPTGERHD